MKQSIARHLERIKTEPGLKRNVIALTSLVLVAMLAGGWILGNQRFNAPWADRFVINAEFEAVPGVAPGNGQEVRIAGVIVGQITDAEVNDDGRAQLELDLEPGHEIYENATFVLRPKSPLNEMYVDIDPGSSPAALMSSGTTVPVTQTRRPVQVDEVLASLDDSTRAALTSLLRESDNALASAPADLPEGLDALGTVTDDLQPVAALLDQRRDYLRRLITAASRISTAIGDDDERLVSLAGALDSTLGQLAGGSTELEAALAQLPALAARLGSSTRAVSRLTSQLDPTLRDVAAAADTLPSALRRLASTSKALDETLAAAKPTLALARPVLADLRPFTSDLSVALPRLLTTTSRLDPVTAELLRYLPDLGAFMVNTRSVTSLRDANGGILRGMIELTPTSLPDSPLGPLSVDALRRLVR